MGVLVGAVCLLVWGATVAALLGGRSNRAVVRVGDWLVLPSDTAPAPAPAAEAVPTVFIQAARHDLGAGAEPPAAWLALEPGFAFERVIDADLWDGPSAPIVPLFAANDDGFDFRCELRAA